MQDNLFANEAAGEFLSWEYAISKHNTLRSVHSVRLSHLMLERKFRIRTQPPYHTRHLRQSDAASNTQDAIASST